MTEKPWQLYTEIPTPTLLTPSSSVIDLSSSTVNADDSTLGNYHQGLDSSVIINGEIEGEEPLVTPKELKGWYIYSAATEVYSVVAISAFIPIILENLASEAGFELDQITPCDTSIKGYKCVTRYGSGFVDTASFSLYTISISVFIQFLVYISFGSLADHGENRKKFLLFFSYVGAISTIAFLLVIKPSLYWLAGLLTIISNVCFGAGFVFYIAYIPTFTRLHPSVSDARKLGISTQELSKIEDVVSNRLSSHSIAIGYAAGVLVLIIAAGISLLMKTSTYGLQVGTALAGVWWFILLTFPAIWLQKRKNPPLPKGENFVFYSFKRVGRTMCSIKKLSQSMKFLISWFLLSDGFNTIISVALIFGKKNLLLNNTQLTIAAIIVPISAFVGVYFFLTIQQKFNLETKTMILITGTLHFLIPIYGLFGFTTTIGFKHTQEIFIFAAYFGFMLGAIQSYCRVLFGSMIPQGHENEFFGLYAITDKGSSWVGPLITGLIGDLTHDLRYGFWFLLGVMIIPLLLISNIDVKKGKKEAELYFENEQSKFKEEEEEEEEKIQ